CPLAGPEILLAVEAGRSQPVLQREVVRIADTHASLLGAIDEKEPTKRPEGLAAKRPLTLLIQENDALAGLDQLAGGNEPGEPSADDDGICVHPGHLQLPMTTTECRQFRSPAGRASRRGLLRHPLSIA